MNYAELADAIANYTENFETSFLDNIPTFVKQAEQRIYRSVMVPELRNNVTSVLPAGSEYLARPVDFLATFSIAVIDAAGRYHYLLDKDVNFIREAYPSPTDIGRPKYYGIFDGDSATGEGNFIIGPSPDVDYGVQLHYFYEPESIVDAGTSWLGTHAKTTLLYGALIEAYTYMKGDADLLATYTARYQEALSQLAGIDARTKRDDYRDGQIRTGG